MPYVITTLSPGGAEEAEAEGLPVIRGDASKQLTLQHAGIQRAKMVVIADDDPATAHRIAAVARTSLRARHAHRRPHALRRGDRTAARMRASIA